MRIFTFIIFFSFTNFANASIITQIINNFESTKNMKFNFVQTINGKVEEGKCTLVYPKKIFCEYISFYNKILVSNGKSLVINSDRSNQYYRYQLEKTPLNLILDKKFLINKMNDSENFSKSLNNYSFKFIYEQTTLIVHFDKNTLNLIGWTTNDIYQNQVETKISNVEKNLMINSNIFKIQNYIN